VLSSPSFGSDRDGIVLPIAYKEASPVAIASASALEQPPPVRLAVVVLGECTNGGKPGLLISRRLLDVKKENAAWNAMWVFPGGGVDVGESLEDAAVREYQEEIGLKIDPATLTPLCLWQAAVPAQHKQYLIIMFKGSVIDSDEQAGSQLDIETTVPELQVDEVSALAFLPRDALHVFVDNWQHELQEQPMTFPGSENVEAFAGWEAVADERVQRRATFNLPEMEGDGGWKSGVSGGNRFALIHYLAGLELGVGSASAERASL
jgi:8-oxo-dGTP pyrophosphatase MutT (NUDIX family)